MENINTVWEFVVKYYPGYYSSDTIAHADDLQKIIDGEAEEDSDAHDHFVNVCDSNMNTMHQEYDTVHKEIYEDAIAGYVESQKQQKDPEELWSKIQALSQQVFWKEQQRVTDGIALGELKKVLQEYGVVK